MKGLPTSRLMELKTTLQIMTDSALIEESEMVNILNKAGLYKYKHAKHTWVDTIGSIYTFSK